MKWAVAAVAICVAGPCFAGDVIARAHLQEIVRYARARAVKPAEAVTAKHVVWHVDYQAAQRDSAETGRPLLIYFTQPRCGPCRAMEEFRQRDEVARLMGRFTLLRVDVSQPSEVKRKYAIRTTPTEIIVGGSRMVAPILYGWSSSAAAGYRRRLEFALEKFHTN